MYVHQQAKGESDQSINGTVIGADAHMHPHPKSLTF